MTLKVTDNQCGRLS